MVLTAIIDSACKEDERINPLPELEEALELMQSVANRGNKLASHRLGEIRTMWDQLCVRLGMPDSATILQRRNSRTNQEATPRSPWPGAVSGADRHTEAFLNPVGTGNWNSVQQGEIATNPHEAPSILSDLNTWGAIDSLWGQPNKTWETFGDDQGEQGPTLYHDLYLNGDWALTGEDVGDFAELGRQIAQGDYGA